jgi:hypothetical protein
MIKAFVPVNSTPYASEDGEKRRTWKIVPAQVMFALRIQGKRAHLAAPAPSAPVQAVHAPSEFTGMAETVKQFAELQSQALQKGKPKG